MKPFSPRFPGLLGLLGILVVHSITGAVGLSLQGPVSSRHSFSQPASTTVPGRSRPATLSPPIVPFGRAPRRQRRTPKPSHDGLAPRFDELGAAKAAIDAMNAAFYNQTDGRWSTSDAWWVTANALTTVVDYMNKTGSRDYMDTALHTIEQQRGPVPWWPQGGGLFRADSTDDTGWV
jgi:hypothetical protein